MVIPLTAGFIFAFAQRVEAQENKNMPQIVEVKTDENGISEKEMKEYKIIFKKVKNSELVKEKESIWMLRTYKRMSSKQKQTVGNLYKYIPKDFFSKRKKPQVIEIKKQQKTTFHKNWFITIDGQKYFYTFDKNERVARYYKNGKLVKLDIVKEYKKKHKIYENLKATGKHYVFKSENDKKEIDREFSDLGGMYYRMSKADKNKVPFPNNPHGEYIKLVKNDNSYYYKKRSELNSEDKKLLSLKFPPPPPLKKNATKNEVERYNKAYKIWKERTKNIPPPPKPVKIKVKEIEEVVEVAKFIINAKIQKDKIELNCYSGCAWTKLTFSTKNINIDKFGTTNSLKSENSSFLFNISKKKNKLYLKAYKGTAWTKLSFYLNTNQTAQIDQFGVKTK